MVIVLSMNEEKGQDCLRSQFVTSKTEVHMAKKNQEPSTEIIPVVTDMKDVKSLSTEKTTISGWRKKKEKK